MFSSTELIAFVVVGLALYVSLVWPDRIAPLALQPCARLPVDVDYVIVGAGSAGLQLALLLEKRNVSYVVLEKELRVASFWLSFPRFDELISINRRTRDADTWMRYDWHSMLEARLLMYNVSTSFFPSGKDWQRYFALVTRQEQLNVCVGVHVRAVADNGPCVILDDGERYCAKRRLFLGTGLRPRDEPLLRAIGAVPYAKVDKSMASGRTVCVLGNGNSGFEVAQNLLGVAERVLVWGRHPHRLSSVTKYTGDVRVKYLQALENFHSKLRDMHFHFSKDVVERPPPSTCRRHSIPLSQHEAFRNTWQLLVWMDEVQCELFVSATGFDSVVPHNGTAAAEFAPQRFPNTSDWFEDSSRASVHYIGWLMHGIDFRRGSGGFFSGFRYLIRELVNHVMEEDFAVRYPRRTLDLSGALHHAVARIQTAADLTIMQDGVVLRDMLVPLGNGTWDYYEGVPYKFFAEASRKDVIFLYFTFGDGRNANFVFDNGGFYNRSETFRGHLVNGFLHPIVEINGLAGHISEDLDVEWKHRRYEDTAARVIFAALLNKTAKRFIPHREPPPYRLYNQSAFDVDPRGPIPFSSPNLRRPLATPLIHAIRDYFQVVVANNAESTAEALSNITAKVRQQFRQLEMPLASQ